MSFRRIFLFLFIAVSTAACATRSGSALFRRDIGTATAMDMVDIAQRILLQNQYEVESVDSLTDIRIITHWKRRVPFADEQALGITAGESRVIVQGRQRGQTELGAFYAVTMTVENRVQTMGATAWTETVNTDMFTAYASKMVADFKRLIDNIGVRRF